MYQFPAIVTDFDPRLWSNLILRDDKIRLTWIPKNMCTTLKLSMLLRARIIANHLTEGFLAAPHKIHEWTFPLEPYNLYDLEWPTAVAVIRHPAGRLRSALIEKAFLAAPEDFDRVLRPVMDHFERHWKRPVDQHSMADVLTAIRHMADRLLDVHLKAQVSFLSGRYTHLLRMEQAPGAFFQARGIPLVTVDSHSASKLTGDPCEIRAGDPIIARRRELFQSGRLIRFDGELETVVNDVAARRYAADIAVWTSAAQA